jgi:hypothetical protein
MAIWLGLALSMKAPLAVRSQMYHLGEMSAEKARQLSQKLAALSGVAEAVVLPDEGVAILKVKMASWDEQGVQNLIKGEA